MLEKELYDDGRYKHKVVSDKRKYSRKKEKKITNPEDYYRDF